MAFHSGIKDLADGTPAVTPTTTLNAPLSVI